MKPSSLTLNLALITHRPEGIDRVANQNLPQVDGVRYIVSWQAHENAPVPPSLAARPDVEIHKFDAEGLSRNRNNAIEHCTGDIILFADDDIMYSAQNLCEIITTFQENPDVDVATFRSINDSGCVYPTESTPLGLRMPKNYFVSSVEIAFRRATAGSLRCCPELGLGSPRLHGGEDEAFLLSAILRGLNVRFFPITICEHDHPSTGTKSNPSDANLRASGCIIALYYGWSRIWRIPLKAFRLAKSGRASFIRALRHLISGSLAAHNIRKQL